MTPETDDQGYRAFLLAEYNNIAQAHFDTGKTITQFFQFYLLLLTLPITILGVLLPKITGEPMNVAAFINSAVAPYFASLLAAIAAVGLCMMAYVINLRLDVLLYARTVNGIRNYFILQTRLSPTLENGIRVLPRSIHQPRYFEPWFFGWVVLAFGFLDSLYSVGAAALWNGSTAVLIAVPTGSLLLHLGIYGCLAWYRNAFYLKTRHIGIDIDGVLADHRPQFAKILQLLCHKTIDPETIDHIPVHECKALGVTKAQERQVLNNRDYWVGMPIHDDAAETIKQLKNVGGYRIDIFSFRTWPTPNDLSPDDVKHWLPKGFAWVQRIPWFSRWLLGQRWPIQAVTRDWLRQHEVLSDSLTIERGNIQKADRRARAQNRFIISAKRGFRVFVEDELPKAIRLANTCEHVLLYDQPYNRADDSELPANVFRIHSWKEVGRFVRERL